MSKNCNILPIEVKWALPVGRCWQNPSIELADLGQSEAQDTPQRIHED